MIFRDELNHFDDRFACFGGELDMVGIVSVVKFVVSAVIFRFFRCARVLFFRIDGFLHLFWAFDDLAFFEIGRCLLRDGRSRGSWPYVVDSCLIIDIGIDALSFILILRPSLSFLFL